jgi:beta-galactosidase
MIFGGETYTGWLTRWWEDTMQSKAPEKNLEEYGFLMSHNKSYTMYVAHGGTNFGLTAGSNDEEKEYWSFKSVITSYDYDAPISEQGSATEKYDKLRELIVPYTSWEVPEIPAPIPMMTLPAFQPKAVGSLLENIEMNEKVEE